MECRATVKFLTAVFAVFLLAGCASTSVVKRHNDEMERLRVQVASLEARVEASERRQQTVESKAWNQREDVAYVKGRVEGIGPKDENIFYIKTEKGKDRKGRLTVKQIQLALKEAGYDPGKIDGKLGDKTVKAIKDFQKAHGLKQDGKVGPKTEEALREYL